MQAIESIKLSADLKNLERLTSFVSECARERGITKERDIDVQIAVEEAFVNICSYAYVGGSGEVEVNCSSNGDSFVSEIIDSGVPFDITILEDPDITADISEREIGGLGGLLIRKLMNMAVYRREGNKNILRLIVHHKQEVTMVAFNFEEASQTLFCLFDGRMDTVNSKIAIERFNAKLSEFQSNAEKLRIVFDLGTVDYVASQFLRFSLSTAKGVQKGNFSIVNTDPQVLKVFMISGLVSILKVS
jgi:serine/threonine-protein kinase RsbW